MYVFEGLPHHRLISTKVISGLQMSSSAPNLASLHAHETVGVAVPSTCAPAAAGRVDKKHAAGSPIGCSLVSLGGLAPAAVQPLETLINSLNLQRFENYLESLAFDRPAPLSADAAALSVQIASTATLTESDSASQATNSSSISGLTGLDGGCLDKSSVTATTRPALPTSQPVSLVRSPDDAAPIGGQMVHAYTQTCSCLGICSEHISSSVPDSLNQMGLESSHHMYSELLLEKFKKEAERLVISAYDAYMLKLERNKANFGDLTKAPKKRLARDKSPGHPELSTTSLSVCDESSSSSPQCSASPTPLHSRQRTFDSGLSNCKSDSTTLPSICLPSNEMVQQLVKACITEQQSALESSASTGCVASASQNDAASDDGDSRLNTERLDETEITAPTDTEDAESVAGYEGDSLNAGSSYARDDSDDSRSSIYDADLYSGNSPRRELLPDEF